MLENDSVSLGESLSSTTILKYVDDYSIYCHYLGEELELKTAYSSPLREDKHPSFSIWRRDNGQIYFKDQASTSKGDVFEFVKKFLQRERKKPVNFNQVLENIDKELQLGLVSIPKNGIIKRNPQKIIPRTSISSVIKVTDREPESKRYLDFWKLLDIGAKVRNMYCVTEILLVHFIYKNKTSYFYPRTLGISYRIGDKHKLYYPYESKENKFKTNYPQYWVEGYLQLKRTRNFCLITKATKEIMFIRQHFDWDSVAGKSENTKIPPHIMFNLFNDYDYVLIMLDNDPPGIAAQKEYIELYPELISLYWDAPEKDITDSYVANLNKQKILIKIKNLIEDNNGYRNKRVL